MNGNITITVPDSKPSLHEIAAMPFPSSAATMRKYYDAHWGEDLGEAGEVQKWKVTIDFSVRKESTEVFEVEASSAEEAEAEARKMFREEYWDYEIEFVFDVKPMGNAA